MIAPHTRPDTCQHPVTRQQQLQNYLLRKGRLYMLQKWMKGSLFESIVAAQGHELLVPYEVQDQELVFV